VDLDAQPIDRPIRGDGEHGDIDLGRHHGRIFELDRDQLRG
jgi:hypothetical protein